MPTELSLQSEGHSNEVGRRESQGGCVGTTLISQVLSETPGEGDGDRLSFARGAASAGPVLQLANSPDNPRLSLPLRWFAKPQSALSPCSDGLNRLEGRAGAISWSLTVGARRIERSRIPRQRAGARRRTTAGAFRQSRCSMPTSQRWQRVRRFGSPARRSVRSLKCIELTSGCVAT
jgi:hypothetical protein